MKTWLTNKTLKVCNVCKQSKDLESFYNSKATKDGKTYTCKVCTREYSSNYKKKNKKKVKAYSQKYLKQYYRDNREDRLLWQKEYRGRNIECRRQYDREQSKKYYQNNKEYFLEKSARRRARKLQAVPPWVDGVHTKRIQSIYKACRNVSERSGKQHHVDHTVPLKGENVCGLHVWWNLRIVPAQENLSKGNRFEVL